ncbi:MAG: ABC transporter ATP-binding protein [Chloroflexi bacterium]|nr:ABC transporter ATP-binding protein [Chloroflexota bacterium]
MAIIQAVGLTKRFGRITAVEDLNLEVEEGEVLGFLGPNGAGKTTTIRLLAGMLAPTSGHARVAGFRADKEVEALHEVIGVLTESPGFYHRFSAQRNLEFFAGFYNSLDSHKQVEKYLKLVGLWERREDRVGTFSRGMKQRLALARALLNEPRVVFLDEPTVGLDPEAARDIRQFITGLSREGRTVFLSTHNLTEAEALCRRIAVIRTRLLALDTAAQLRRRFFRHEVVIHLEKVDRPLLELIEKLGYVKAFRREGNLTIFQLAEPEKDRPELVKAIVEAGGRIISVSETGHPLEEVYLKLVGEEGTGT